MIKFFLETILRFQLNYGIFSFSRLLNIDLEPVRADSSKGLGSRGNSIAAQKEGPGQGEDALGGPGAVVWREARSEMRPGLGARPQPSGDMPECTQADVRRLAPSPLMALIQEFQRQDKLHAFGSITISK